MNKTLWTKNFTIITLGTIISSIGSVALNLVLSYVVFTETESTFLSGLFGAVSLIPNLFLPLIFSTYLDRIPRKPVIVALDFLSGCLMFIFGFYILKYNFNFIVYLIFSLLQSCISSVYSIAYDSLYPNLIPEGMAQKGYTISSMIYPTVTIIASPLGSLLYTKVGIAPIILIYGILLWIAAFFEHFIRIHEETSIHEFDFKQYIDDMKSTVTYLKEEKGIRNIYLAMPFSQGFSEGSEPLIMAYFSNNPALGITLYSLFTVAQFIGRFIGGIVNYKVEYPKDKRFSICYFVYIFYSLMDAILLFLPYPFMLLNRAITGFCGINSATLRTSSVQNYIPDNKRAKLNAFMNVFITISSMFFKLLFGALGEFISIKTLMVVGAFSTILVYHFFLYRNKEYIKPIYNKIY